MTRIELGGGGIPIPKEALPDGLTGETLTPLTFTFEEDGSFDKTQWTAFGYTIFQAMCVGGAGGRGPVSWYMNGQGTNAPGILTSAGGGGGGGGMHIVSGLLADLADISDIIVGQAGIERGIVQPSYSAYPVSYNDHGMDVGLPGGDGGYSKFGDICMASGGKGGAVSPVVLTSDPGTSWRPGGNGGDGGIGGSIIAGGGAAGGFSETDGGEIVAAQDSFPSYRFTPGEQGFWDGNIGEGGGGGVGGTGGGFGVGSDAAWIPEPHTAGFRFLSVHDVGPSEGGHGNFNYADPSKYGSKEEGPITRLRTTFNPYNVRDLTHHRPGGGGGARPTALAKYGSYADGYSPNGVVIVRIS